MDSQIFALPKPYVFVLMPFDKAFDDIYKFGIKGAAEDAGAYAERIDEQIFQEGILERIINQISKADVIVADMTGRNANVFYEVGFAHALGKIVLLLTKNADDIPFDLKHHQHIVYEGSIDVLRSVLAERLKWAIKEAAAARRGDASEGFEVIINDVTALNEPSGEPAPVVQQFKQGQVNYVTAIVRNISARLSSPISHIYLFAKETSEIKLYRVISFSSRHPIAPMKAHPADATDGFSKLFELHETIPAIPADTFETLMFGISVKPNVTEEIRLRLHTSHGRHSFRFKIAAIDQTNP